MGVSLGSLAAQFGCELIGDPDIEVRSVATLGNAGEGAISFLANPAYRSQLEHTGATAVILTAASADACPVNALVTDDAYVVFARVATLLYPRPSYEPGIHATAVIHEDASVDPSAHVGPLVVVEAGARVGARVYLGAGCVVGARCDIGDDSHFSANVTLIKDVRIGKRAIVHGGVVIGADGFGHKMTDEGWLKVPQVGGVQIGDDVEIGASTTIDCGAIDDTVIEDGVKLDNQIQIAHNCHIGAHTVIASGTGVSGSTKIGSRCIIAGMVGFVGHISVCDNAVVTGAAVVTKDITEPGVYTSAFAVEPDRIWKRQVARFRRLGKWEQRLRALERNQSDADASSDGSNEASNNGKS